MVKLGLAAAYRTKKLKVRVRQTMVTIPNRGRSLRSLGNDLNTRRKLRLLTWYWAVQQRQNIKVGSSSFIVHIQRNIICRT